MLMHVAFPSALLTYFSNSSYRQASACGRLFVSGMVFERPARHISPTG
jgi:hypothetical protein